MEKTQKNTPTNNDCDYLQNSIRNKKLQILLLEKSQAIPELVNIEKSCLQDKIKLFKKLGC